jgi:hypothetical protein
MVTTGTPRAPAVYTLTPSTDVLFNPLKNATIYTQQIPSALLRFIRPNPATFYLIVPATLTTPPPSSTNFTIHPYYFLSIIPCITVHTPLSRLRP